jgi:flagellar basal body-associated protein FliL
LKFERADRKCLMAIVIVIVIVISDGGGCYILFLFRRTEEDLDFLAGFSCCLNC